MPHLFKKTKQTKQNMQGQQKAKEPCPIPHTPIFKCVKYARQTLTLLETNKHNSAVYKTILLKGHGPIFQN